MVRILSTSVLMMFAALGNAQTQCNTDNALFRFDNTVVATEIHTLGHAPEFPFLRNLSSPAQVFKAIKTNYSEHNSGYQELNGILMAIGFNNGVEDLHVDNISTYYLPSGTEGNMGSRGFTTGYFRLSGDASDFKSWKITSSTNCYVYIMAKCGNAFYPKSGNKTACITAPVNLTSDMQEITLNGSGQKTTTTNNVYIYTHTKRHRKMDNTTIAEITIAHHTKPLLLRSEKDVEIVPETYKVSLSTPDNTVNVCPDSVLNITASINVEKTSEFTGNYPDKSKKVYKEESKRVYRKTARKMRKAERKENQVARLTNVDVNV